MNERQVVPRRLLVPGGDPSIVLDPVYEALDDIPRFVLAFAVLSRLKPVAARRDHRLSTAILDVRNQRVGVIALVGDHSPRRVVGQQLARPCDVVLLSRPEAHLDRLSLRVYGNVQLAAEAAARATETFFGRLFFSGEPAAC
jgi:hypothetical protein